MLFNSLAGKQNSTVCRFLHPSGHQHKDTGGGSTWNVLDFIRGTRGKTISLLVAAAKRETVEVLYVCVWQFTLNLITTICNCVSVCACKYVDFSGSFSVRLPSESDRENIGPNAKWSKILSAHSRSFPSNKSHSLHPRILAVAVAIFSDRPCHWLD